MKRRNERGNENERKETKRKGWLLGQKEETKEGIRGNENEGKGETEKRKHRKKGKQKGGERGNMRGKEEDG
jgi:hypothetical protein